ncbi:transcription factor HES-5-like [Mugil cephalus]|uniref:transcription factor HES-5-like n=1 Tax=Mugil cephalus TaxID=48193 RepID=UPI001FB82DD8|nr:transcription factor HES-5-like [Mugil cephalus]
MLMPGYKLKSSSSRDVRADRPEEAVLFTCTDMAPCSTANSSAHHISIKLRKPIVEKMRRDRINTCIEQLKTILEKEFHKQEPNSKLEKADILEMTVSFLRQQLRSRSHRGYSHSTHFVSGPSAQDQKLHLVQGSRTFSTVCSTSLQDSSSSSSSSLSKVWRPW